MRPEKSKRLPGNVVMTSTSKTHISRSARYVMAHSQVALGALKFRKAASWPLMATYQLKLPLRRHLLGDFVVSSYLTALERVHSRQVFKVSSTNNSLTHFVRYYYWWSQP